MTASVRDLRNALVVMLTGKIPLQKGAILKKGSENSWHVSRKDSPVFSEEFLDNDGVWSADRKYPFETALQALDSAAKHGYFPEAPARPKKIL